MGFELEDLGECFPAVLAAQWLLVLTLIGSLYPPPRSLKLESTLRSGNESWVTSILVSRW